MVEYIEQVENKLTNQFGIGIDDCTDLETVETAFNIGESIDDFIDWIANKHNLIRF